MGKETIYNVMPVSPGIAIGKTLLISSSLGMRNHILENHIKESEVDSELEKFHQTLALTKQSIEKVKEQVKDKLDSQQAAIFDAHILMLEDKALLSATEKEVRENLKALDWAFFNTTEYYAKTMEAIPDSYLSERASDIRDIAKRFLSVYYCGEEQSLMDKIDDKRIIIANELTPSETVNLDQNKVLGFAVENGSETSHSAILARSMHMPAVVNIPEEILKLKNNTRIILDGFSGRIIVHPSERTLEAYRLKSNEADKLYSLLLQDKELVAETKDGFVVQLGINLDKSSGTSELEQYGAEAVGLFRTEMLFLGQNKLPTEDEQFEIYKELLTSANNKMVVIRTLDIGGDKANNKIYRANEQNPFLGLRGIRLCLHERRDLFTTQLRALIRAGVYGDLKIMLPMLSSVGEVHDTRAIIADILNDFRENNIEHSPNISLGGMVETPACALMVEHFAQILDFLSIGTNDLVQYTMSIDRGNERVAYLYQPASPAVLELIYRTVNAAKKNNIWVSVCGQMAGDPLYTPLLLGLGVNELSMESASINTVRRVIRSLKMSDAENMTYQAMKCTRAKEVRNLTMDLLKKSAPEVAELLLMQNNIVLD